MVDKKLKSTGQKITSVVARESNGNIQITFNIPYSVIEHAQEDTIAEMAKDIEVPGFRRGMAPIAKVREKISQNQLIEHSLSHVLPNALSETIVENKLRIAIYPKFELIKAGINEPWEIKGLTCELPEVELGDYKKEVSGALKADSIIVPGKEEPKQKTKEQKESIVIQTLLKTAKVNIPSILVEEEANGRLSNLLTRLEKLGLALENYLASMNKKAEDLKAEYATQAKEAIALDLILNKVAEVENIKIDPKEVDAAFQMSQASVNGETEEDKESRKRLIESILRRRSALDSLLD